MRIDISIKDISEEDMLDWAEQVEDYVEKHAVTYNMRYGDDWEK